MSELVKSSAAAPIESRKSRKTAQRVKTETPQTPDSTVQPLQGNDLVAVAVHTADTEFAMAVQTYDARRTENIGRFFQHVGQSQSATTAQLKQYVSSAYGLSEVELRAQLEEAE